MSESMTLCSCRLRPIEAAAIEGGVYAGAVSADPALTAVGWPAAAAQVLARLYTRIEVGGTVDDVRFVRRT